MKPEAYKTQCYTAPFTAVSLLAGVQVISFAPSMQEKHGPGNENVIQRQWMCVGL